MAQDNETSTSAHKSPENNQKDPGEPQVFYFDLFNRAPAGYCTLDENGLILEANFTLPSLLDISPNALVKQALSRFILSEDQEIYGRLRQNLSNSGAPQACELRMERYDGSVLWTHLAATLVQEAGGAPTCRIIVSDFTPHMQTEQSLRHLYVVLAQVNQAIVHYRDRNELFRAVCRIAVKFGDFRMAWIGLVDAPTGQLKPIAHEGYEEGYLKSIHINVNPGSAFSQGPSGQAILKDRVVASHDSESSPQMSPWRNEARKRGYRSSVAVPFRLKGKAIGSLNLYAGTPAFYSGEELDLLKQIGDTLSFALECFEIECLRQQAEAALRESEAQNRAFIHAIPDLIFMNKRDGEYLAVHAPDPRLLAAPPDTVLHRKIGELLPKPVADRCLKAIATALDSRTLRKLIYTIPVDGRKRRFEARVAPCTRDTVLTIVRDITELKPVKKAPRKNKPRRRKAPNGDAPA